MKSIPGFLLGLVIGMMIGPSGPGSSETIEETPPMAEPSVTPASADYVRPLREAKASCAITYVSLALVATVLFWVWRPTTQIPNPVSINRWTDFPWSRWVALDALAWTAVLALLVAWLTARRAWKSVFERLRADSPYSAWEGKLIGENLNRFEGVRIERDRLELVLNSRVQYVCMVAAFVFTAAATARMTWLCSAILSSGFVLTALMGAGIDRSWAKFVNYHGAIQRSPNGMPPTDAYQGVEAVSLLGLLLPRLIPLVLLLLAMGVLRMPPVDASVATQIPVLSALDGGS